ncbi:MAG: glycosyltransferase [Cyanobacteria bacterium J06650_10]
MISTSDSIESLPIRALFVVPAFYRNGAVSLCVNLAEKLGTRNGIAVEVLATRKLKVQSRLPKVPIECTIVRKRSKLVRLLALCIQLIKSAMKADVVILTWENGLVLPTLAALILRKPTLAIVQNNIPRAAKDYPQRRGARTFRRWAYRRAQAVVCTSKALTRLLKKEANSANINQAKITAISNGIDVANVIALAKEKTIATSSLTFLSDDAPFVVGIGRLSTQKGFDILIRAHSEVRKQGFYHRLVLIGEGDDLAELTAIAQRLDVADSVIFVGYLENPYPVLGQAALFCSSSRYEGYGLAVAEAAALGVPTIATNCVAGPGEILANGAYGDLVETESVMALSAAISNHFKNPQRLQAKARASARDAERLSLEACAQEYSDLIRRCVS